MLNWWINSKLSRHSSLNSCRTAVLFGALLASTGTASADNLGVVRDLASRVGPIIGSAQACPNVARSRVQVIVDKFQGVIREASNNDAERGDVSRLFERYVADGRGSVSAGKTDCKVAERQIADLEQSIGVASPSLASPSSASPAPAAPS